jgi:hypothetical protein
LRPCLDLLFNQEDDDDAGSISILSDLAKTYHEKRDSIPKSEDEFVPCDDSGFIDAVGEWEMFG